MTYAEQAMIMGFCRPRHPAVVITDTFWRMEPKSVRDQGDQAGLPEPECVAAHGKAGR